MNKTVKCAAIAFLALVCVIVCVKMFLTSGNGLWAIWAVIGCGVKVAALADAIECVVSEDFLDRLYGKGGRYE